MSTATGSTRVIQLTEYEPKLLHKSELSYDEASALWQRYKKEVGIEFPSPKTGDLWQLTSQGVVGFIPVSPTLHLALAPKVPLANVFRMVEYAYQLGKFHFLDDVVGCRSLDEFYQHLARTLAVRVLDRGRKGFYRTYVPKNDQLPYLTGRLDTPQLIRSPWSVNLRCDFEDHTADVADNQILAWTLLSIARSGLCSHEVLGVVRKAFRELQGAVSLSPCVGQDCVGRLYHRLNSDYEPLHGLCRFFLDHCGPRHEVGERKMISFLIDMSDLFEKFVAEWMKDNLPLGWRVKLQEKFTISEAQDLSFRIDLVLYGPSGERRCVLDTKYKATVKPSTDDICQVVAYALAKGCKHAILVYPQALNQPLDEMISDIRVRSVGFSLAGDLQEAGNSFLGHVLGTLSE